MRFETRSHRQHVIQRHGFFLLIKIRKRTLREAVYDLLVNPIDEPFIDRDPDERRSEAPTDGLDTRFEVLLKRARGTFR